MLAEAIEERDGRQVGVDVVESKCMSRLESERGDDITAVVFTVWFRGTGGWSSSSMVEVRRQGGGVGDQCGEGRGTL